MVDSNAILLFHNDEKEMGPYNRKEMVMSNHAETNAETNIAWFKLAELIARKEREKALNVYRLLSHSLEDKAYALQIEGDILKSFDVRDATEKYQQAAFLYKKEQRWVNAVGIYEHLISRDPENLEFLAALVDAYAKLDWEEKCTPHLHAMFNLLSSHKPELERIYKAIQQIMRQHADLSWFTILINQYQKDISEPLLSLIF